MSKGLWRYGKGSEFTVCTCCTESEDKRGPQSSISGHRYRRGTVVVMVKRFDADNFLVADAAGVKYCVGRMDITPLKR